MAIAFGQMGMNPADFWRMSWRDWLLKQQGFFESRMSEYKADWERARMLAFYTVSPYAKKGKLNKVTDLFRFDWEKEKIEVPDTEEMRYWMLKYGKFTDKDGRGYNA